jgi:hypothetical protein
VHDEEAAGAAGQEGEVPKIDRFGAVTAGPDSAILPDGAQVHPGSGVPLQGVEHPADGTMSPPVTSEAPEAEEVPAVVTVADQRAAGVAPQDTVTVAEQRAGTAPPEAAPRAPVTPPAPPKAAARPATPPPPARPATPPATPPKKTP